LQFNEAVKTVALQGSSFGGAAKVEKLENIIINEIKYLMFGNLILKCNLIFAI